MTIRVIKSDDFERVFNYAKALHMQGHGDAMEAELASWSARWRKESMEHYLNLGWSFGAWDDSKGEESATLCGFVLCQPLLFFQGKTQNLWLEFLAGDTEAIRKELLDTCYRWARDKHLQQVIFGAEMETLAHEIPLKVSQGEINYIVPTVKTRG